MVFAGPLAGMKVVEFAGMGPGPFCGMLLSDLGADVVRVVRPGQTQGEARFDVLSRGRRSLQLDLKNPTDVERALRLIEKAEIMFEGYRPGVMERLGLGPEDVLARNPKMVYGRMTGWGQSGPLAQMAGHDGNYISISGALHAIGPRERPMLPLNLVGDYGGGGLFLAFGLIAAAMHSRAGGFGQVVDCAMSDCSATLMAQFYGWFAEGQWTNTRGENLLDGGAPFYQVYTCADGKFVSVCSLEKPFYEQLLRSLDIDLDEFAYPLGPAKWPSLHSRLTEIFVTRSRDDWCNILGNTDACFAPVLDLKEAPRHPHNLARETFSTVQDVIQPSPAPRFSSTPGRISAPPTDQRQEEEILEDWHVAFDVAHHLAPDALRA